MATLLDLDDMTAEEWLALHECEYPSLDELYGPEPTPRRGRPRLEDTQPVQPRAVGGRVDVDLYALTLELPDTVVCWQVHSLVYGMEGLEACRRGEYGRCAASLTAVGGQTLGVAEYVPESA